MEWRNRKLVWCADPFPCLHPSSSLSPHPAQLAATAPVSPLCFFANVSFFLCCKHLKDKSLSQPSFYSQESHWFIVSSQEVSVECSLWNGCSTIEVPKPPVNGKGWIQSLKYSLSLRFYTAPDPLGPTLFQPSIISRKLISALEPHERQEEEEHSNSEVHVPLVSWIGGTGVGGNLRAASGVASPLWPTLSGLNFHTLQCQTAVTETTDKSLKSSVSTQVSNNTFYSAIHFFLYAHPTYTESTNPNIS